MVRAQRQMYSSLLTQGLISRSAWMLLDRAADAQLEYNYFYLDQFSFLLTNAFRAKRFRVAAALQKRFWKDVPGVLLLYLKRFGKVPIDELMKNVKQPSSCRWCPENVKTKYQDQQGKKASATKVMATKSPTTSGNNLSRKKSIQDDALLGNDESILNTIAESVNELDAESNNDEEKQQPLRSSQKLDEPTQSSEDDDNEGLLPGFADVSKNVGIPLTAEEWLYTFALASWGFILAQQDSTPLVDEMFTVTPGLIAFSEERKALKVELQEGCTLPALFLDAVAKHAPHIIARIKRLHALSEANNLLFGAVSTLNSRGLLERMELKRLLQFAERSLRRIRNCEIELQHPVTVGHQARLLRENPNFFPFSTMKELTPLLVTESNKPAAASSNPTTISEADADERKPPKLVSAPPSLPQRQKSILFRSTVRGTQPSSSLPVRVVREARHHLGSIQRTRSLSDFNPIWHELEDGTKDVTFLGASATAERKSSVDELFAPSSELVIDRIKPMDVTRLKEVLKLDDAELKKY